MPMSNLQKAVQDGTVFCSINSKYNNHWRDFTLQRGHIYGYNPAFTRNGLTGYFVVNRAMRSSTVMYIAKLTRDCYVWDRYIVSNRARGMDKIIAVAANRIGGVEFLPLDQQDITPLYNPPLVKCGRYMPMRDMRIPGGSRGGKKYESQTLHPLGVEPTEQDIVCAGIIAAQELKNKLKG